MIHDDPWDRRVALGEEPYDPYGTAIAGVVREPHRGFYDSRGYLPHVDLPLTHFVTFRLVDSFPAALLERWRSDLQKVDEVERRRESYRRTESYVDSEHGECWLRNPEIAVIVRDCLLFHDGSRYDLLGWTLMPNHVHLLARIREGHPLPKTVQSWKARSARRANERLGRTGPFWYRDYYDRWIRDEAHLANCHRYIDMNPVKAGLCREPEGWAWGSAYSGETPSATRRSQGVAP